MAPKFYGGFGNSITYKSIRLDFNFQYAKQIAFNELTNRSLPGAFLNGQGNQPISVLNRWRLQGDVANFQRYNQDFSIYNSAVLLADSDAGFSDASYVRLKNVSLSWNLSNQWLTRIKIDGVRIFFTGAKSPHHH